MGPFIGLTLHWLGGLASASFYVPYRGVQRWSWEVYWIAGGLVSWIVAPWVFALLLSEDVQGVIRQTAGSTLFATYGFGVLWGMGGLTFGLTLRYLGISLGMAVALGLTTVFGTLIPPIYDGSFLGFAATTPGLIVLFGVLVTMAGIVLIARAGSAKERQMDQAAHAAVSEFNFRKGIAVAVFSGTMSACFAYGIAAGEPMNELSIQAGTGSLHQGLAALCVILLGGFTTNAIWCAYLIWHNRSLRQFVGGDESGEPPLLRNYLLCASAGLLWYLQFFFYTMGESLMGPYSFSSWTLHMASIILFSTGWGLYFGEWSGVSTTVRKTLYTGIATLVLATVIIGSGNSLMAA